MLLITRVRLMMAVLFTINVAGRIGSWKWWTSTNQKNEAAGTAPRKPQGAHPM
jgi:hypothetical protein